MIRTERQHTIDRAVISALRQADGRPVPEIAVIHCVEVKVDFLAPTRAEIEEAIRYAENEGRILGAMLETGKKFKLTGDGELWALEVRL